MMMISITEFFLSISNCSWIEPETRATASSINSSCLRTAPKNSFRFSSETFHPSTKTYEKMVVENER